MCTTLQSMQDEERTKHQLDEWKESTKTFAKAITVNADGFGSYIKRKWVMVETMKE